MTIAGKVATLALAIELIAAPLKTPALSLTSVAIASNGAPANTGCAANLANDLAARHPTSQIITVSAPTATSTTATLTLWAKSGSCFRAIAGPWPADVGENGMSSHKIEGDGNTPIGVFSIGSTMYGNAPNPGVAYRYHQLACGDWWDESPGTPAYNEFVHVPCTSTPPFGGASEALWRATTAYRYFAVIDYNTSPIVSGRGSAIFLHVSLNTPTTGCVSIAQSHLVQTLRWLNPRLHPLIAIGTASTIDHL